MPIRRWEGGRATIGAIRHSESGQIFHARCVQLASSTNEGHTDPKLMDISN